MIYTGEFGEGERWLQRAARALEGDTGPGIRLLTHIVSGMLQVGRGRLSDAAVEFGAAERLRSQLTGSHALASQVTGWLLATQARLGMTAEARAALAALDDERASSGEVGNARATICLTDEDPTGALGALRDVLGGTVPVIGYLTERALALAEPDRAVLPFAMTGSRELLESLPGHQTAHAALLTDILDILHGSSAAATDRQLSPPTEELSAGELRVLRYLPTNLSRPQIASELSVSPNTVGTHIRSIYAKLGVRDRSSAVRRARELRLLAPAWTANHRN
jgi:LuxR family maltose regulon positive regulatory protein